MPFYIMAYPKSEFLIVEEAEKLLRKFDDKTILKKSLLETTELDAFGNLYEWDLVEPYLIDEYRISSKGKSVIKDGGLGKHWN